MEGQCGGIVFGGMVGCEWRDVWISVCGGMVCGGMVCGGMVSTDECRMIICTRRGVVC